MESMILEGVDFPTPFFDIVSKLYDNFNKEKFDSIVEIPKELEPLVIDVYTFHKQPLPEIKYINFEKSVLPINNEDIVIEFSGGLDSVFLALKYHLEGKKVHLFHLQNLNTFSGPGERKALERIVSRYGFDFKVIKVKKSRKGSPYHQFWSENSVKNQMVESLVIDYCKSNGYSVITSGYEEEQNKDIGIVGYNVTDWKEINDDFMDACKKLYKNFEYLTPLKDIKKEQELKLLYDNKALDLYFSCVCQYRFAASNRKKAELKYNINFPQYLDSCGVCRKCLSHELLLDHLGLLKITDEYKRDAIHTLKTKFAKEAATYIEYLENIGYI